MTNPYGFVEVEPEFIAVMADTLRIYRSAAPDVYGKTGTSGTVTATIPTIVEDKNKTYTTPTGETRQVTGVAYLAYIVPWLTTADRVDVTDPSAPTGWKTTVVQAINTVSGPDGPHHQEIIFGARDQGVTK